MNEIKIRYVFRHKKTNEVVLHYYTLNEIEYFGETIYTDKEDYELINRDIWTGKKDKKEQEIYAGDIDITDDEPMIVTYKDGRFGLKFPDHAYFDGSVSWEDCEIGGNVHQNPKLLEGAK
ncbi:YopX family protein [Bacillus inaquosorum]|uniref:YopX family protein n=1 Tax=Bacillus inaquosorum TaxID=483913 RepID=UPI00228090D7|nr:YopX family protein [Bacillus inaquosorum]MCY7902079.1 YopX family protein [Bacillus inaquosorum]MCY8261555.1 YopX family protein [Bacillus inaquosorum]